MKTAGYRIALAFAVAFFCVGLPYWRIPYSEVALPHSLPATGLFAVALTALVLVATRALPYWRAVWLATAAVPAAVFARVLFEGLRDPTSHNLWPLELIIVTPVGFACALVGTLFGALIAAPPVRRGGV